MGLTKQYLRYQPAGNFNIISSSGCNVVFLVLDGQEGRFVGVGACEDIVVWDLRLGEKSMVIRGDDHPVTFLAASPDSKFLAAGYADGIVKIVELKTGETVTVLSGHRSAITCLSYDDAGHRLASGSKDTDVILWDVMSETGIQRLSGHKGVVTQVCFMSQENLLVTASKDTFVKFWDLTTGHCFNTLLDHRSEVWGAAVMNDKYLVTGSGDSELRVWLLAPNTQTVLSCKSMGSVLRAGRGRVVGLNRESQGSLLVCHGPDQVAEMFSFSDTAETEERVKRRLKKARKKGEEADTEVVLKDVVKRLSVVRTSEARAKIKSAALVLGKGGELRVAYGLNNNCLELHSLDVSSRTNTESQLLRKISSQGHHSEVRAIAFSSDNLAVISASADNVKLWNRPSLVCLRTIETGYVLSCCFVPGDRHVLTGLKDGRLLIIDIASGDILEEIPAHQNELWTISLTPDLRGCVTGGGDATVKFWNFELIQEGNARVLSLVHRHTLKLEETVLCCKISPNGSLLAVGLLDCTVKIFFTDTYKFFVSLYGHKLPVLSLDISYDSQLIVTGSSDRNIKIWGLDFGDCHKSLFAHEDSVTGVQFVGQTHQVFSCGKDGRVKQWDADNFEKILTLHAHFGEARALAVSHNGQYVVSCGSDQVSRLFERTEEPLVLLDEQEQEREEEANKELATGQVTNVPGQTDINLPSKKTISSEKGAELLLECLEICSGVEANPGAPLPPVMVAFRVDNVQDYLLHSLSSIRASDLEEALLLLPFTSVCSLLQRLPPLITPGQSELICKVAVFLVRIHHGPIVNNLSLLAVVKEIHNLAITAVHSLRDVIGVNLHGLRVMQHQIEQRDEIQLFTDAAANKKSKRNRKARKRTLITM